MPDSSMPGPSAPGVGPLEGDREEAAPTESATPVVPSPETPKRDAGQTPAPRELIEDPERLVGLRREALGPLLGKPDLLRSEPPAEVWQYVGGDCVLDLFLYPESGRLVVVHLEARGGTAERQDPRHCLGELLAAE